MGAPFIVVIYFVLAFARGSARVKFDFTNPEKK